MPYPEELPPASLPTESYTEPFWLTEPSPLADVHTPETLPEDANMIIIGSGLTGSFTAYWLLKEKPELKIVMLEARELCSGASARNGGQIKTEMKGRYGAKDANYLYAFEVNHLKRYEVLLAEEKEISCSFHITTGFDVCTNEAIAMQAKAGYEERRADFPEDMKGFREIDDLEELERLSGVKDGFWGCMYRVGSIWPYKLATGLLAKAITMAKAGGGYLNLQTRTPVHKLEKTSNGWCVMTDRGKVSAPKVILCTNGYTSHLLPEFSNHIVPVRGTCSSLRRAEPQPSDTPSEKVFRPLFTSTAFRGGSKGGEYMISRQEGDKNYILGGGKGVYAHDLKLWYGVTNDNELIPGTKEFFDGFLPKNFKKWPHPTSNLDMVWTGNTLPWVGEHPKQPEGLYIGAAFHGHGMCRILGSTWSLTRLILSEKKGEEGFKVLTDSGLPSQYLITDERMASTHNHIIPTFMHKN